MAGVWGRINREEVAHEQDDSGNECTICYAAPQNVRFKPCNHAACKNCVEDLRRTNIFKVCMFQQLTRVLTDHLHSLPLFACRLTLESSVHIVERMLRTTNHWTSEQSGLKGFKISCVQFLDKGSMNGLSRRGSVLDDELTAANKAAKAAAAARHGPQMPSVSVLLSCASTGSGSFKMATC